MTLDVDVIEAVKAKGVNLSALTNEFLRNYVHAEGDPETNIQNEIDALTKNMDEIVAKIGSLTNMKAKIRELKEERRKRIERDIPTGATYTDIVEYNKFVANLPDNELQEHLAWRRKHNQEQDTFVETAPLTEEAKKKLWEESERLQTAATIFQNTNPTGDD